MTETVGEYNVSNEQFEKELRETVIHFVIENHYIRRLNEYTRKGFAEPRKLAEEECVNILYRFKEKDKINESAVVRFKHYIVSSHDGGGIKIPETENLKHLCMNVVNETIGTQENSDTSCDQFQKAISGIVDRLYDHIRNTLDDVADEAPELCIQET